MKAEIKIPAVGESITEATIAQWTKKNGDRVKRDEILLILETDKASVEVVAEHEGVLNVNVNEGQTVAIGSTVGFIDTDAAGGVSAGPAPKPTAPPVPIKPTAPPVAAAPKPTAPPTAVAPPPLSPSVRRIVEEKGLSTEGVSGSGKDGRLTKGDVLGMPAGSSKVPAPVGAASGGAGSVAVKAPSAPTPLPKPKHASLTQTQTREPMTKLRQTIARRLVEAQSTAAILTTFNEIDMTAAMALRAKYKEKFKEQHGINLGFMGFFVKAAVEALKAFPRVNGLIEGTDIVYNNFYNVGVAVGTEKGLVVPVVKDADQLSISDVEKSIKHYAEKARDGKISLDDMTGGTFTISNGGVYGSMMSTPILNPPQSAILGLHKIEERPVVIAGKIEIRSMMYVALSYDHRIIDGGESVSFLVKIKEGLEDPARLLLEI